MANRGENCSLKILNTLMTHDRPLTTNQLCDLCDCDRKTVYRCVNKLETNGFGVTVTAGRGREQNTYKFGGIVYGF